MSLTRTTGLLAVVGSIAVAAIWAGCSSNGTDTDGGTDAGGNDAISSDAVAEAETSMVDSSVLDCTYYCSSIASVCSGNETQYESTATCMTMCGTINNDAGFGMTSGDTLSCRMYFLSLAAVTPSPAVMCAYAGPYGFGGCGTLCNDFCEHYFNSVCGGKPQNGYPSYTECTTYCAAAAGSDASAGDPGSVTTGAGMPCREYHLENAIGAGGTGGGHCAHAGEDGGGVCPP